ncbi:hypothetical protein DsansV1_C07g0075201 [Dioscorea sansibarensis]
MPPLPLGSTIRSPRCSLGIRRGCKTSAWQSKARRKNVAEMKCFPTDSASLI